MYGYVSSDTHIYVSSDQEATSKCFHEVNLNHYQTEYVDIPTEETVRSSVDEL